MMYVPQAGPGLLKIQEPLGGVLTTIGTLKFNSITNHLN